MEHLRGAARHSISTCEMNRNKDITGGSSTCDQSLLTRRAFVFHWGYWRDSHGKNSIPPYAASWNTNPIDRVGEICIINTRTITINITSTRIGLQEPRIRWMLKSDIERYLVNLTLYIHSYIYIYCVVNHRKSRENCPLTSGNIKIQTWNAFSSRAAITEEHTNAWSIRGNIR